MTDLTPVLRRVRQSTIGDFDICQRRAQYNISGKAPRVGSEPAMCGTGYHAGLETYYVERKGRGFFVPTSEDIDRYVHDALVALETETEVADRIVWDTSHREACDVVANTVRSYFAGGHYWPDGYDVVAVEWTFDAEFLPTWDAHGTADLLLLETATNRMVMVDHKTAGRMWSAKKAEARSNNQGPWYVKWIRQAFPEVSGVDVWFDVMRRDGNKFQRFPCVVEQRHIDAVTVKAATVAHLLDLGIELPPNQTSNLCSPKYCDAWEICPYGAALT